MEPIINHLKVDPGMNQCLYKNSEGNPINVSLAVIALSARKYGNHPLALAS
jgi:hypothetical protein